MSNSKFKPEIIKEENGIKAGIISSASWRGSDRMSQVGWGNGYVMIPKGHPWYDKNEEKIKADAHGGLTYANYDNDGNFWIGFDTCHYGDNPDTCPKEYVISQTLQLFAKALKYSRISESRKSKNTEPPSISYEEAAAFGDPVALGNEDFKPTK